MAAGCIYTYKGKKLNERQLKNELSDGDFQRLVRDGDIKIPGLEVLYSLGTSQNDIYNNLLKLHDSIKENDSESYLFNDKRLRRVTSIVKAKQREKFGVAVDQATQDIWDQARDLGVKLHNFNEDIVNKLIGRPGIVDLTKLNANEKEVYSHLQEYISNIIKPKLASGSKFLAEVRVADADRNMAGKIDLVEIMPNGKINIYDYKTRSRETLNKIKLDEYSRQLKMYADMLQKALRTDVLQRRIIPIKISKEKDGKIKVDIKEQEPVALEKTGVERLDMLLDKLDAQLDSLESRVVSEGQKLVHNEKIERLKTSIKSIQMTKDLTATIEIALDDVQIIINDLNNGTFDLNTNLKEAHDILGLYKEFDNFLPKGELDPEIRTNVGILLAQARQAYRDLEDAEKKYLITHGNKYGIIGTDATQTTQEFLSPVKELSGWDRYIQGASYSDHPIMQTLRRAVEGALYKTRQSFVSIRDEVKAKQKAMFDYLGSNNFDPLLQTYANGKRTGGLVDQVLPEYWIEARKAKTDGKLEWFMDNSVFNYERYNKELDNYRKFINKSAKLKETQKKSLIEKWVKENQTNWFKFHTAKEKWFDPKWTDLTKGKYKGTPVEEFYNYYRKTMADLIEDLPLEKVYDTFIPNLSASFLQRTANVGVGAALKASIDMSWLEVFHEDPHFGKYDIDNNPIDSIPILYTDKLNPKDKSYDLGLLLTAFAGTAHNFKNLSELEALKEASLAFVRNQDEYLTTSTDQIKTSRRERDRVVKNASTTSHYGQLKDYVDVVFYGRRRSNEKTKIFKSKFLDRFIAWSKGEETVTERDYAWSKLFDGVLNFTAIKALGFNLFAPVTNYLSAESMSFMNGVGGLYFDTGNKAEALKLLASNNEKAKLLIDKFHVKMGDFELDELKMLSTDMVTMGVQDMAFSGFHLGDYVVQNSNFIAMLLSGKHEVKWDDFDVVDGKLVEKKPIEDLDIIRFRNRAMKVNKKIMGNMDKNDYASIKRYALGRAIMQFRNWLPAMFSDRWGRRRFDYDLEMWTEGRYRTGLAYVMEHVLAPMIKDTKSKFLAWRSLTPEQRAALRANVLDLVLTAGVITLLAVLRGDDNEDRTMMSRYSIRVMDRVLAELTFFGLLPVPGMISDKYQIIISPAASVSTLEDLGRIIEHTYRSIQGDEEADPARAVKRLAPGINQITKLDEILSGEVQY
jgi:hypothetical protein